MYMQRKSFVTAALSMVLAVSPTLLAQDKQPNIPSSRNNASTDAEGKILWQYNTDG
jgi:hypothetical protein